MKTTSSYKCKITNLSHVIQPTLVLYREAVTFLVAVCEAEYERYVTLKSKEQNNYIESLIHRTAKNTSVIYNFDEVFYKFPSYLRRCAVQAALGIVSSYRSNVTNYEEERYLAISNGKKFQKKPPQLQVKHTTYPVVYQGNMFVRLSANEVKIKLFHHNDWVWFIAILRQQDVNYLLKKTQAATTTFSPVLEGRDNKYALRFSFEFTSKLRETPLQDQTILAVDLGINNSAVVSVMSAEGTVMDRLFINQPIEKDRMYTLLNRLKKVQKQAGSQAKHKHIWRKITNLNRQITHDTINQIMKMAKTYRVDVIVFEYLQFTGQKKRGTLVKTQMWAKQAIQEKVAHKAHIVGIRMNRVNARNTSALAFDGSGKVKRLDTNASLCIFPNNKQYHSDLNASYNIGARYFIQKYLKSLTATEELAAQAKVPELKNRTNCTLSTWRTLCQVA